MTITAAQIEAAAGPTETWIAEVRAESAARKVQRKAWEIANPELALGDKIDRLCKFNSQKDVAAQLFIDVSIVRKRAALYRKLHKSPMWCPVAKAAFDAAWIEEVECPLAALCRAAQ